MVDTTIKPKPKQEQFDFLVEHLRKQGKKCEAFIANQGIIGQLKVENNNGEILYDPIGAIFPDWAFLPDFDKEGMTAKHPLIKQIITRQGFCPDLAFEFQKIHDSTNVKDWENEFSVLAFKYRLIYKPLENIPKTLKKKPIHIGYLVMGKFHCLSCAFKPTYPKRVKIYDCHVGNYSQLCWNCKKVIINGITSDRDIPVQLF